MNPALPVPEAAPAATPAAPGSGPPAARRSMFFPPVCPTRASDPAVAEALAAATAAASAARDNAAPAAPAPAAASSKKKRKSVVSPPPQPPPSHEASEPDPLAVLESLSCAGCASCAALRSPPVTGSLAAQPPHRNPLASTLKTLLAENWKRKQEEHQRWFEETGGLENDSALRDRIMQLRAESEAVATVRKDRIFDSDITEEESVIIQRRVELQRLQFQEYQRREHARKIARVQYLLNHVTKDEAEDAIKETGGDESQAVINFTAHGFLVRIRKAIAARSGKPLERTEEEQAAYNRLLEKRRIAARKITSEEVKKRSIKYSRLKLDDALDQLKQGEDPNTVFMGWSEARIRSYRQINTKPNSYYYRFNAPGEKQRHGQWTEDEKQLFFARLREVGADGQWGIFSMAIPGRVGYQCSNFYRHLLKTGEVEDSNYMLDDRGELHYLFGKKDGGKGVIRVHSKHGAGGMMAVESRRARAAQLMAAVHDTSSCTHSDQDSGCRSASSPGPYQRSAIESSPAPPQLPTPTEPPDNPGDSRSEGSPAPHTTMTIRLKTSSSGRTAPVGAATLAPKPRRTYKPRTPKEPTERKPRTTKAQNSLSDGPTPAQCSNNRDLLDSGAPVCATLEAPLATTAPQTTGYAASAAGQAAEAAEQMDVDVSGSAVNAITLAPAAPSKRQRSKASGSAKPPRSRTKASAASLASAHGADSTSPQIPPTQAYGVPSKSSRTARAAESEPSTADAPEPAARSAAAAAKKRRRRTRPGSDDDDEALAALSDEDNSGTYVDRPVGSRARRTRSKHVVEPIAEDPLGEFAIPPENPLPGFIDPITLEEVVKPAISPYGHVMGYDSWLRCLTSDERKNICPLTKKPLTKRELVVLTHDNIAHFRDKIVNM